MHLINLLVCLIGLGSAASRAISSEDAGNATISKRDSTPWLWAYQYGPAPEDTYVKQDHPSAEWDTAWLDVVVEALTHNNSMLVQSLIEDKADGDANNGTDVAIFTLFDPSGEKFTAEVTASEALQLSPGDNEYWWYPGIKAAALKQKKYSGFQTEGKITQGSPVDALKMLENITYIEHGEGHEYLHQQIFSQALYHSMEARMYFQTKDKVSEFGLKPSTWYSVWAERNDLDGYSYLYTVKPAGKKDTIDITVGVNGVLRWFQQVQKLVRTGCEFGGDGTVDCEAR
ncbi:hypothetical protein IAT40_003680 [Kwoniella sp. CBS 6097]